MEQNDRLTMDFFEHQSRARKKTGLLIFLFVFAVILIIISVYAAFSGTYYIILRQQKSQEYLQNYSFFNLQFFLIVSVGVIILVAMGSFYKILSLGGGGAAVAKMLAGRKVNPNTDDPLERRLINVVDEVAIASGVPAPEIYILDNESGINAFAAGYSPSSAVIAVTRGALKIFDRDELQSVVGHEFSHILNGDMRLNIRLIGVLFGILLISVVGRVLIEITARGSYHRSRSSSRGKGGSGRLAAFLFGAALLVIGYIGVFFGRLIKAAVSRQREFLADSSSAQFTRNPSSLASALKKIGGYTRGSKIKSAHAEEASHMFFSKAVSMNLFSSILATHPPLEKRIRALEPRWDERFIPVKMTETPVERLEKKIRTGGREYPGVNIPGLGTGKPVPGEKIQVPPLALINRIGMLSPAAISYASEMMSRIPHSIDMARRSPEGAQAVVFAVLMNREEEPRKAQWQYLKQNVSSASMSRLNDILPDVEKSGEGTRLTLIDLAMPALRQFSPEEAKNFLKHIEELVKADEEVTLFEYAMVKIIRKQIDPVITGSADKVPVKYHSINALLSDVAVLLSVLARAGAESDGVIRNAFSVGVGKMRVNAEKAPFADPEYCTYERIDEALDRIRYASPPIKRRIMHGLAFCVLADKEVSVMETEMLRAVADSLDCPIPPILNIPGSEKQ